MRRRRGEFCDDMLLSIFCTSIFTESVCSCKQSLLSILSPLFLPEAGWVVIERKTVFSSPPPPNEKGGEGILSSSFPPPFKKPLSPISHSGHVRAIEAFFFPPPPFPIGAKEVSPGSSLSGGGRKSSSRFPSSPFLKTISFAHCRRRRRHRISSFYKITQRCNRSSRNPSF